MSDDIKIVHVKVNMGVIQAQITKHCNDEEKLKQITNGLTEKQLKLARSHLKTVLAIKRTT